MARHSFTSMGVIGIALVLLILLTVKMQKPNRGMMGIGALILFLAIVIVAAIAAAVLISSGTSLQQKALITSNEAREAVASGLEAVSIKGSDSSSSGTPHAINRLQILARLISGSSAVSLNNTILTMDTTAASQTFGYGGTVADSAVASGTGDYVITYVQSGPYQSNDIVNLGDLIKIKFNIEGGLGENMRGRVTIIPRSGSLNQIEFVTPDTMMEPMVVVWPSG